MSANSCPIGPADYGNDNGNPDPLASACTVRPQPGSATSIGPSDVMCSVTEQSTEARFTSMEAFERLVAVTSIVFAFGPGVGGPHVFARLVNSIAPRLPPVNWPAPGCVAEATGSLAPAPCVTASICPVGSPVAPVCPGSRSLRPESQ